MDNVFARLLAIATLITGIFWCLKRFKLARTAKPLQGMPASIGDDAAVKTGHKLKWIEIFASLFPVFLLVFVVRSFIFEPFQIPSGSMMPTLLVGDFILVEKFAYDIKDPLTQTTFIKTGHPKRGDVVVFKYPPEPSKNYIKRVVGLPGDRVLYDTINKLVTVQPGCGCTIALPVTYCEVTLSDCVQMVEHQESLGSMPHNILTVPGQKDQLGMYYKQPGNSLAEWVVPQGKYFMMGDNRDNSADSRYWGFVPERNLIGKATVIWMSFDKQEGKWPTGLRLSRIGRIH